MGLAHELGHAAREIDGQLIPLENKIAEECINVLQYELPIALQLGEPFRFTPVNKEIKYMNNSTHFVTTHKTPWWLGPSITIRSQFFTIEHNVE